MKFKVVVLLFLCQSLLGLAQEKAELYYLSGKPETSPQLTAQCKNLHLNGVTFQVTFFTKNAPPKKIIADQKTSIISGDSILYILNVSKTDFDKSDHYTIHPIYHLVCKSDTSIRGSGLDYDGDDQSSKKIALIFNSNPQGAEVYLIPQPVWAKVPTALKSSADFSAYKVYQHPTRVQKNDVQEYVYIAFFKYNGKTRQVVCSPTFRNPVDSVYADFSR